MINNKDAASLAEPTFTLTVTELSDDRATIALSGRFDVVEALSVREQLAGAELAATRHLTVDLRTVTFVDSAGLAVLARARRDRALVGGSVTLIRPTSEEAMRVFRLTQFDQIFTMIEQPEGGAL
jgi:anti-anti-sigma factor